MDRPSAIERTPRRRLVGIDGSGLVANTQQGGKMLEISKMKLNILRDPRFSLRGAYLFLLKKISRLCRWT